MRTGVSGLVRMTLTSRLWVSLRTVRKAMMTLSWFLLAENSDLKGRNLWLLRAPSMLSTWPCIDSVRWVIARRLQSLVCSTMLCSVSSTLCRLIAGGTWTMRWLGMRVRMDRAL